MFKTVSKHRGIEALMNNKTVAVQLILTVIEITDSVRTVQQILCF